MRLYKVMLLVNLAVGVGFLFGFLWWGQELGRLRRELTAFRQATITRAGADGRWSAYGIVRVVSPEINRIFIDHGDIPGLMEAMTMAFEPEDSKLLDGLIPGDPVRFTLQQKGERVILVGIEKGRNPGGE
jgi:Cu/Ag efflux protein CusF